MQGSNQGVCRIWEVVDHPILQVEQRQRQGPGKARQGPQGKAESGKARQGQKARGQAGRRVQAQAGKGKGASKGQNQGKAGIR